MDHNYPEGIDYSKTNSINLLNDTSVKLLNLMIKNN